MSNKQQVSPGNLGGWTGRFVNHPTLSIVISILIVIAGVFSMTSLSVEQFPDMAPPTIEVVASYPGASAETVQKSVVEPLEQAINGVDNMTYMTSTASNTGEAAITVYFDSKSNADMDAVNVQNAVQTAMGLMPSEVTKTGVTTMKQQNSQLRTFALYCEKDLYDKQFLDNYMSINVIPRLKRIKGVGQVMNFGSDYSLRIWLDPAKMAQRRLVPADVNTALEQQNLEASTGSFGENHDNVYEYSMKYRGRYTTPEEFGNIIISAGADGELLRLKDVARIELGDAYYNYTTHLNGHDAAMAMVYQTAGSNASSINNEIDRTFKDLAPSLPQGMKFVTLSDSNRFLKASVRSVVQTLIEAIILVIVVVLLFLQNVRSTFIPSLSIIVSIVGTFAFMKVAGFSINLLTLFALVLAIGTVVDDAIIVVEAVQERMSASYPPKEGVEATHEAMHKVGGAILTSTLIFMAVFIPVSLINGTSGMFFRQFGLTMAAAVGISGLNAFTLTPALCALLLSSPTPEGDCRHHGSLKGTFRQRFHQAWNASFMTLRQKYISSVMRIFHHRWLVWSALGLSAVLLVLLMRTTPTGLVPDEDLGDLNISVDMRPGTSLVETTKLLAEIDHDLSQIPEIEYRSDVAGYSFSGAGPSMGMFEVSLRPWDQRKGKEHSIQAVMDKVNAIAEKYPQATMYVMSSPLISGYGSGDGFELNLQDRSGGSIQDFKAVADSFSAVLSQRKEIGQAFSAFNITFPQYWVDVDAAQCALAGITPSEVLHTISDYYSGNYASNINRFSKVYQVQTQAEPSARVTKESLEHIFVRTKSGEMAPVTRFVTLTKTVGPQNLSRFNLYNSIGISGSPAKGFSSGDAIRAIRETAAEVLPQNYSYEFSGLTREESNSKNNTVIIFLVCIVLVYLIMSSLYDSFILPFAILLSVPIGLLGTFLAAKSLNLQNNVYMQTGMIMLIGLLSKTAVLITDYALQRRRAGMSLPLAAFHAAKDRFRPILMTVLSLVFGLLPLMVATGVGANGSRSLASGVVGGMVLGTLALLFLTPFLFVIFQSLHERIIKVSKDSTQTP